MRELKSSAPRPVLAAAHLPGNLAPPGDVRAAATAAREQAPNHRAPSHGRSRHDREKHALDAPLPPDLSPHPGSHLCAATVRVCAAPATFILNVDEISRPG